MTLSKENDVPGAMYLVKTDKKDIFQLHTQKGAWEGSLRKMWQKMHFEFGVKNQEVRTALQELDFNDDKVAHFGIFGTFIFTSKEFPVR